MRLSPKVTHKNHNMYIVYNGSNVGIAIVEGGILIAYLKEVLDVSPNMPHVEDDMFSPETYEIKWDWVKKSHWRG